jgi:hypothetical protein
MHFGEFNSPGHFFARVKMIRARQGGTENDAKRAVDKIGTRAESRVSAVTATVGLSQKQRQPLGLRLAG